MQMPRFPRLEQLFNHRIDDLTVDILEGLIRGTTPLLEDTDLDFKVANYGNDDAGKRSVATDIASFANNQGGLILIGVEEVNGAAAKVAPVEVSDTEELRIKQIAASLIAPVPQFELKRLTRESPTRGLLLIAIPPSADAPHAVRVGEALRYCKRDGSRNRALSENEVADAYRARWRTTKRTEQQLAMVESDGLAKLSNSSANTWLGLSLVPSVAGAFQIDESVLRAEATAPRKTHPADSPFSSVHWGVGAGKLTMRGSRKTHFQIDSPYAELHKTGAGFAAIDARFRSVPSTVGGPAAAAIESRWLVMTTIGLLSLLHRHATTRARAFGDAVAKLILVPGYQVEMRLGDYDGAEWDEDAYGTPLRKTQESEHTINLQSLSDTAEHLIAARLLLTDLFQAFGRAEVPHIDKLGALRMNYWRSNELSGWSKFASAKQSSTAAGVD